MFEIAAGILLALAIIWMIGALAAVDWEEAIGKVVLFVLIGGAIWRFCW